ncbi:MAG: FkbM family methyltransferase [Cyclobacteriaceae bacterium]
MKAILRSLLRKMGLLNWIRKARYRNQHRKYINQFKGQSYYDLQYKNIDLKFSLADPFSSTFFSHHFKNGVYEAQGLDAMLNSVGEKSIVLDVGANIGYFTCFAGKHCRNGHVHAFEMGKANFEILNDNVELNRLNNVTTACYAVADTSSVVQIQDTAVGNAVLKIIEGKSKDDLISVNSITLDEYCTTMNIVPEFIKIDVEGAEMKVLKGMRDILSSNVKLLIEVHETDLKYFQSSKEEVLNYIRSFGYNLEIIGNDVKKNLLVFASK